jgi:hypothetical protein
MIADTYFTQEKVSASEWSRMELPVLPNELKILKLIQNGYHNTNICLNDTLTLASYLKIYDSNGKTNNAEYFYNTYFASTVDNIYKNNNLFRKDSKGNEIKRKTSLVKLNSSDNVKINKFNSLEHQDLFEFVLLEQFKQMTTLKLAKNQEWHLHFYTLIKLLSFSIEHINSVLLDKIKHVLDIYSNDVDLLYIITNAYDIIENNNILLKYQDIKLFNHQINIFDKMKTTNPKLVLYSAPTGTGKTLTPLGLCQQYKVIYVCAAKHVGLALARCAVSSGIKFAVAFSCHSAGDVRLHYSAVKDCKYDAKTGKRYGIDNSIGHNVQLIISDVSSYLPAMNYMLAQGFEKSNIVTYWDEPTISLDKDYDPLHDIIHENWIKNQIPNMVLCSATLPKESFIKPVIAQFKEQVKMHYDIDRDQDEEVLNEQLDNLKIEIINIQSSDSKMTMSLINKEGFVVLPHMLIDSYEELLEKVESCNENLGLLRYLDTVELTKFIKYVLNNKLGDREIKIPPYLQNVNEINMYGIKKFYLSILKNISKNWEMLKEFSFQNARMIYVRPEIISPKVFKRMESYHQQSQKELQLKTTKMSGVNITTSDAFTLTHGPTIYLANDIEEIGKFCLKQANIPSIIIQQILNDIKHNEECYEKIKQINEEIDVESKKPKKVNKKSKKTDDKQCEETSVIEQLQDKRSILEASIKQVKLDDIFVPNTLEHIKKWYGQELTDAFCSKINGTTVEKIMSLSDVDDNSKLLLLMGIGVFSENMNSEYVKIMVELATNQHLYLIIANSDYIYGTNYQFCHGYMAKDLIVTQEKLIQSIGRVGRHNIQRNCTIRFRDNNQLDILFSNVNSNDKIEVKNMNKLLG